MGAPELALSALKEAQPLVDSQKDPRLLWGLHFNLVVILCDLGRFAEADAAMNEVIGTASALGNELDLVRALWLRGRIEAGLGREREAEAAFDQVRDAFRERGIAYDFAKATLALAELLSGQRRFAEVRTLARQTAWIFNGQGIHGEARKALRLFCEVAETERFTAELARRILLYLEKAQRNPDLRFDN